MHKLVSVTTHFITMVAMLAQLVIQDEYCVNTTFNPKTGYTHAYCAKEK